jgi:hypothetical protein
LRLRRSCKRTEFSGVLVRAGGQRFQGSWLEREDRGFRGLGEGGRTVYWWFSEVFVLDEVFGRSWNDRKKKKNT